MTILTSHGKISYRRTILVPANQQSSDTLRQMGKISVCPMDEILGVERTGFRMTYKAMAQIAREGITSRSYADACRQFNEKYHIKISETEVKNVTDFVGKLMFNKITEEAETAAKRRFDSRKRRKGSGDIAYLMADGAMVHIRDNGAKPESGIAGIDGWVESKHAIFIDAKDIEEYGIDKDGNPRCKIIKKSAVGYIGPSSGFEKYLIWLARRTGFEFYAEQVIVIDGCLWLRDMLKKLFPYAQIILDKCHAKENAGEFAKAIKVGSDSRRELADQLCDLIDAGDIEALLNILEPYKDSKLPDGVVNMYTYVTNHIDNMEYPEYARKGYYVGSGAMESSNKSLMQSRLKLIGMRWNRSRAQNVLTLKMLYECGMWDEVVASLREYVSCTNQ